MIAHMIFSRKQHTTKTFNPTEQNRDHSAMVCMGIRTESLWLLNSSLFLGIFRFGDSRLHLVTVLEWTHDTTLSRSPPEAAEQSDLVHLLQSFLHSGLLPQNSPPQQTVLVHLPPVVALLLPAPFPPVLP